jgi:predicted phage baseplate assembly protein
VVGIDTSFTTSLSVGQWLLFASDSSHTAYQISAIADDDSLTLAANYAGATAPSTTATLITPASGFLAPSPSSTSRPLPQIAVYDDQGEEWDVLEDLLSSTDTQRVCVLEIEHTGSAFLRFGDDQYGQAPETGMDFQVRYRVGNGSVGNIGRDSLAHILTNVKGVTEIRNPLAAAGGVDPETMDHIRQVAPFAFRTQLRAVTENDYGVMAERDPAIREARGTLRWTGSWYTAFVSVDTVAPSGPNGGLLTDTQKRLNLFRMMGVDLAVEGVEIVGLRIEMNICVDPDFFQADVETALINLFTTGNQCTGQPGILNPENFTFGQTIYTSPFIAAAQRIEGVTSATMTSFQRMDDPSIDGVAQGYLTMGRLEIARCDNDPNRLDHGIFVLHMDGGK